MSEEKWPMMLERTGSESTILAQLLYPGLSTHLETEKYGHAFDLNMKLLTHHLNEQSCQIVLFFISLMHFRAMLQK